MRSGISFLPLVGAVLVTATMSSSVLLPRIGPRPLVTLGMLLSAAGMVMLTQLDVHSAYAAHILPGLVLVGMGLGLVVATGLNTGTLGVSAAESGVASALVNTMQQVGGSLGTALLSTISAGAATSELAGRPPTGAAAAQATVHGYTTAFWWATAIFAAGAVICGLVLRGGRPQPQVQPTPALAG